MAARIRKRVTDSKFDRERRKLTAYIKLARLLQKLSKSGSPRLNKAVRTLEAAVVQERRRIEGELKLRKGPGVKNSIGPRVNRGRSKTT